MRSPVGERLGQGGTGAVRLIPYLVVVRMLCGAFPDPVRASARWAGGVWRCVYKYGNRPRAVQPFFEKIARCSGCNHYMTTR